MLYEVITLEVRTPEPCPDPDRDEVQGDDDPDLREIQARALQDNFDLQAAWARRITSYNVCYTKLLRAA